MAADADEGHDGPHQGADGAVGEADEAAEAAEADEAPPRGTLLLAVLFLVVLAGAWWLMYFVLIERG